MMEKIDLQEMSNKLTKKNNNDVNRKNDKK